MNFEFNKTIEILKQTPEVLYALLQGISDEWVYNTEGGNSWSVFDVVGHLIVCEKTDFIARCEIMLAEGEDKMLATIDMNAQFNDNKGKTPGMLLKEFDHLRKEKIMKLLAFDLADNDFVKTAIHPKIGKLTLAELLATWAEHDLNHIAQITRVMAKQYKEAVGPFIAFLNILK